VTEATCTHCGVDIDFVLGRWVDAGSDSLIYCDDGTGLDNPTQRHEPIEHAQPLFAVVHVVNVGTIIEDLDRQLGR